MNSIKSKRELAQKRPGERSFTLLETMISMTILVTVVLHVSTAQGNMVYNANYGRRMTEAMWLARGVMAKVEYYWGYQEFKSLESDGKVSKARFKEMKLPEDTDYTYSLAIKEWKFPILELLQNGGPGGGGDGEDEDSSQSSGFPIKDILKNILGDHILKVAHVEVFWPEGAKEHSVTLTYLLTNQRKVDEYLYGQQASYKKLLKQLKNEGKAKPKNTKECRERDGPEYRYDKRKKTCVKSPGQPPDPSEEPREGFSGQEAP